MKVGTDGILLGSWAQVHAGDLVLDVGTGTGLLALMVAQRAGCLVDAIEIDKQAYIQASSNVLMSKWKETVKVYNTSLQAYAKSNKKYDLIICNPPFYTSYMKPTDRSRCLARNNESLSLEDLVVKSCKLMNKKGRLAFIIPYEMINVAAGVISKNGLNITRMLEVKSRPGKSPIRVLFEASIHESESAMNSNITISDSVNNTYTEEYRELTKDFYLNF